MPLGHIGIIPSNGGKMLKIPCNSALIAGGGGIFAQEIGSLGKSRAAPPWPPQVRGRKLNPWQNSLIFIQKTPNLGPFHR